MRQFQPLALMAAVAVLAPCTLFAQANTTVQLPNFNFTTVNTTVTAPDGGTVLLGGINRASEGSVERGVPLLSKVPGLNRLFKNRGIGREMSASNFTVIPRIIILEEEEERQVGRPLDNSFSLNPPPGGPAAGIAAHRGIDPVAHKAALLSSHISRSSSPLRLGTPAPAVTRSEPEAVTVSASPEEIRRANLLASEQRQTEALTYFEKGREAALAGKTGAAKVYFNMAARRSTGEFHDKIVAHLEAIRNGDNALVKSP